MLTTKEKRVVKEAIKRIEKYDGYTCLALTHAEEAIFELDGNDRYAPLYPPLTERYRALYGIGNLNSVSSMTDKRERQQLRLLLLQNFLEAA